MPEKFILKQYQALPLRAKVMMTAARVSEWYHHFGGSVCVSFSGGKDSTVLAHIVHEYFPDVPLVFANTGLEYPEIQSFARKMGAEFVRPKMSFSDVISTYGYPIIGKENAEAIYYARRIRNSMGGVREDLRQIRNAENSTVPETMRRSSGELVPRQSRMEKSGTYRQDPKQIRPGVGYTREAIGKRRNNASETN